MSDIIFCNWVGVSVDSDMLNKTCFDHVKDGRCDFCKRSEQLKLGMDPKDLLRNLKGCT